ncbi:unannotated protein [freshwater metagenome]|uniref:Unannotated protein n=1 Tax=freshwater metagenome TaxID=449393 RepID=A0A6J6M688_9ZZZZ
MFENSLEVSPEMRSLNVTVYESVRETVGVVGTLKLTVGAELLTVVVVAIPETPGVNGETVVAAKRIHRPRTCEIANGG